MNMATPQVHRQPSLPQLTPKHAHCQRHQQQQGQQQQQQQQQQQLHQQQQGQQLRHSHSITALPSSDVFDSYSGLPAAAPCPRHLLAPSDAHSRWCHALAPNLGPAAGDAYCHFGLKQRPFMAATAAPAAAHWPSGPACVCGACGHPGPGSAAATAAADAAYQQQLRAARVFERSALLSTCRRGNHKSCGYACYFEHGTTDEEDSAFPALPDREFHLLHRNIPALRRTGVDVTSIRQYFYPDGGWGWIICGVSFLVHLLTTGLQLSYGLLLFYAIQHLPTATSIEWLGALSWSVSMLVSPFVVAFCRKKSTRLSAVVGGLVLPLGMLFTSFATELGQVVFSYGLVFGIGVAMVRESSAIMLGNYFKRRRQFVEMVALSGEGIGIALFSVILKEGVGEVGWRFGLQIISGLLAFSFFMGLLYRPASLYHPQRRAIQHLKNQRKKMRENRLTGNTKPPTSPPQYLFLDISTLKSATVKVLLMAAGVAALGIYTPMFLMSLNAVKEGSDIQDLVLLQAFLGISTALGVVIAGALARRPLRLGQFLLHTQMLCQIFISLVAVAILFLSFVMGYKGMCVLSWIYGIGFGGFRYSFKMLALERVKLKQFAKAWGFIHCVEAVPVLCSVPLTSFLNDYSLKYGRAGYYICSAAAAIGGIIIFFISYSTTLGVPTAPTPALGRKQANGLAPHHCHGAPYAPFAPFAPATAPVPAATPTPTPPPPPPAMPPTGIVDYIYNGCDYATPDLLRRSCLSLNQADLNCSLGQFRLQCLNQPACASQLHQAPERLEQLEQQAERIGLSESRNYSFGQGSIGSRTGKRLQKSLSFIQPSYGYDGDWYDCRCRGSQLAWNRMDSMQQPLLCTCNPETSYLHSSRSRSVPEGLSAMSQQCTCGSAGSGAPPTRHIIYMPRHSQLSQSQSRELLFLQKEPRPPSQQSQQRRPRPQRSQSLSRPCMFVEQITTSV